MLFNQVTFQAFVQSYTIWTFVQWGSVVMWARPYVRGLDNVRLHCLLSIIAMQAWALGIIKLGRPERIRSCVVSMIIDSRDVIQYSRGWLAEADFFRHQFPSRYLLERCAKCETTIILSLLFGKP